MMDNNGNGDEARYNLATRIMSNGVEVIVAGDKSTLPGEPNVLRILPSSHYKQTTMPASTLKGDHMVIMLPDNLEIDELSSSLYDLNKFVTRTCLTTYTYLTTYLQDGTTTVESREKVISNTATEERNLLNISPTPTAGLTFSQTPKLAIGTFPTTYTYLNTIFDGDQPIVLTSKHTVTNTITAPDDYLSLLQPSEAVTAVHDTNTYYSTVALTKTIHDNDQTKVISTDTVFTQIVITESLPSSKITSVMTSYVAFDVDDPLSNDVNDLATTDVVKTYYVTYTYLNTLLDNGSVIVRTNVSTSSDIVTEKLYLYSKRTEAVQATAPPVVIDTKPTKVFDSLNIFATKTYLTTFTYFTTILQVNSNDRYASSTVVDSHTNVVENVITESLPNSLFPTESLSSYYSAIQTAKNPKGIVTIATLLEGQTLEVTAIVPSEPIKMSSTIATSLTDKLVEEDVHDNTIPDDISEEAQSSNVVNSYAEKENNKIEKIDNQVNDLIGSFNLNSLTAFGPVFNALTGLIQNNFAKNSNDKNVTALKNETIVVQDETGNTIVPASLSDISGRNPIYIPVGGIADEEIESAETQNLQLPHFNTFVAPQPPSVKWVNNNGKQIQELVIGKPSRESALLNGGIAISPGDVITANSDVIIGSRPTGISPRIPLHSNTDDPPPFQSFPHHVNNNVRDSIPLQSIQTESYIGPPPPLSQQKNRLNVNKNQIRDHHRPVIPFNNIYNDHGTKTPPPTSHQEIRLSNAKKTLSNNFLVPPPFKPQVNYHQEHQLQHKPLSPSIPLIPSNEHLQFQQPIRQQINNHYQPQQIQIQPSQSPPNIQPIKLDPLFEIQQIPEVFSTDLPPVHVLEYPIHQIEPSIPILPQASIFSPLPEIIHHQNHQQSTGQPLLVDIQPSQIANIIIPHGSTTALIYGGANELHKNGQYFDEPSPYVDADINLFYTNKPNKTNNQNVINVDVPHNHQQNHVNIQPHKPILANHETIHHHHEINMNANVLSQDVDLHAPPIKFNLKEENYPSVQLNQHFDFERVNGYVEEGSDGFDNVVSSSKHQQNEHRPAIVPVETQNPVTHSSSDLTDLFNQQSNYVAPHYNHQDYKYQPNANNHQNQNQKTGDFAFNNQNVFANNEYNHSLVANNIHNGKNYHHKNQPNVDEYNGPPPQLPNRQRQRPNVVVLNEANTKSQQTSQFYQHHYPQQQNTNRPAGSNVFLHTSVPQQSNRPKPGKIVNFEQSFNTQPMQQHQKPVYINLHEHIDSGVTHSNAPSVKDVIIDEHKDDDFENEEGEVIQESNSVPVVPGQRPKDVFNMEVPTTSPKTTFYEIQQHSSTNTNEIINTQTESNYIWNVSGASNANPVFDNKKPIRYPSVPPAVLINELRPDNLYPPTISPVNKNRLEYGHRRRPIIPVRPLESPPLHQPNVIEPRPSLQPPPRLISEHQQINIPRPSLEPPTQGPSKNPFVISKNTIGFNKNRLQISMPIDTVGLDTLSNVGQTEEPFDPRYTSTAKGNPFVIRLTTSPSIFETTTPKSSTLSISTTTTTPIPTTTPATTRQSIETTRFSPTQSTKQNAVSKLEITLNTGEVTTKKFIDNYVASGESESSGVINSHNFDTVNEENILHVQESINPHNFGIVKEESILPNRNNPHIFVYEDTVKQQQENIKLDYPEPSVDMMPPPPTKYHENLPSMSTEEVMGLNPPPLPTPFENEVITQRPAGIIKSSTSANTHSSNTTAYNGFRSTSRPYRYETIFRGPQDSDTTTARTRTRTRGTTQSYQPVTRSTSKPIPLLDESESNSDLRIQKPPRIYESHKRPNIQPTPSVTTKLDNSLPSPHLHNLKETGHEVDPNKSRIDGHNRQYSNLNTKYKLPSDILILGTEQSISDDKTSSSSTASLPTRRTHTLPQREYETISTTPISTDRTTNTEQITHVAASDQSVNSNAPSSRFKTKSPPVILPTRYITNTKTLTVTTTKTTVIRSQGITTTLTLTLTKTSTILDTITHQITHTLVQPTIATTSSLMEDDKIVATSTVQEVPPYSHYPSFPVQATASYGDKTEPHPTFLEDEANLDEFIINYDDEITVKKSSHPNHHRNNTLHSENESIFVVMTDQKQPSIININPSMIDQPHRINAMSDDKLNEISDVGDSNSSDVVNRDEDDMTKDVNHVLLGGILIASPPRLDAPKMFSVNECRPDCKASRNELCQKIEGQMKCVCRPGFARMFPDRPCKPTYTYTINLPLVRHGSDKLKFEEALTKNSSPKYTHLSGIVHNGLDRMVMQSDLRDIYHGVHVVEFKNASTKRVSENDQLSDGSGITSVFYLQLSDNYDDMRLLDIFHKYLRNNNYSLGGTDLYSSQALIEDMTATDFDECISTKFNDCSEDAHCFNLRGTYTCSCKEGYADLSGNPIYPGRICSAELIGCEKCNYHGTCYSRGDDQMLCECFQWYAGNYCHVNLKVMLIALITVGLILFMLLLICLIMTCCKRKRPNNRTLVGMGLVANKLVPNQRTMDRRAMIQETSSETSEDTHTLPYDRNKQNQLNKNRQSNSNLSLNNKFTIATQNSSAGHSGTLGMEQKDRSLTVMIPRAKYHPAAPPPPPIVVATTRYNMDSAASVCSTTEAKLLSYLDASPSATTDHPRKKSTTNPLNKHGALNTTSTGALISAGFEVSATVGTENDLFEKIWLYNKLKSDNEQSGFQQMHQLQEKSIKSDDIDGRNTDAKTEVASTITHGNDDKLLLSPMGEWMDIDTHNEMTMSEARSYYETTIQPSTKTFRHTTGSNKAPSRNNEEANTMAERDLGSTFLLPHTHLYKPDRGSDISGFDSL